MTKKPDKALIYISFILVIFGIVSLLSASAPLSQKTYGSPFYIFLHQLLYGIIPGIIFILIILKIPMKLFKKYSFFIMLFSLFLVALVFLPHIGIAKGGARRWVKIGRVVFQPSEFLKVSSIIYFSAWISEKTKKIKNNSEIFLGFIIILLILIPVLYFQPDISTLGIIVFIALSLYFVANTPLWHNILIWGLFGSAFILFSRLAPYRMNRISVFLHPDLDPLGKGYQIKQSLIAIGSGGLKGVGLGLGRQKFGFLPSPASDAIFSVISEELGFIGAIFLISLFLALLIEGIKIAKSSKDDFNKLTSIGITIWIVSQAFLNIGAMTKILPLTGIPLPFISAGGSAILAELIGLGILLNISKQI